MDFNDTRYFSRSNSTLGNPDAYPTAMSISGLASLSAASQYTARPPDQPFVQTPLNVRGDKIQSPSAQRTSQHSQRNMQQTPLSGPSRRSKYTNLDWTSHQAEIKRLYLEQNKSLAETMRIMKEDHSFEASTKLYKDKIKRWGWQKNLPAKHALLMAEKAHKRKREAGKETVFSYGDQLWDMERVENSAARVKRPRAVPEIMDIDTPSSISYKTPKSIMDSPYDDRSVDLGSDSTEDIPREIETDVQTLKVSWQGLSKTDLSAMLETARTSSQRGESEIAETMFLQALEGYSNILGRTHEDTNKVAYALAEFYTQEFRHADADKILENLTQEHIRQWGCEHRRTVQHILHTVELFNGWNRPNDALALLASSQEVMEAPSRTKRARLQRRTRRSTAKNTPRLGAATSTAIREVSDSLIDDGDPAKIDVGLGLARARVIAKDEATESFLEAIISRCELDDQNLATQNLRARSELLNLYTILERIDEKESTFLDAKRTVQRVWDNHEWDEDKFQCIEVMEAGMQLAARMLKADFKSEAISLFRDVTDKAIALFGSDDERFI